MTTYTPVTVIVPEGATFYSDGTADVFKKSLFSGKIHVARLPISREQWDRWSVSRMLIQDALPHLSKEEREFLMSGATPDEWNEAFKEEDDK
jgi:hypothetical protein